MSNQILLTKNKKAFFLKDEDCFAVPPFFLLNQKWLSRHSILYNGSTRNGLQNSQPSGSKATFHTADLLGSLSAGELPSLSDARCVLLFFIAVYW